MFRDLKNFILKLSRNKFIWRITYLIVSILGLKSYKERLLKMQVEDKYFDSVQYNRIVLRGPFKGMKYNSLQSYCSDMAPKIIGSYESELNGPIEEICKKGYSEIIDIGCAEGYYAVGLALRIPKIPIFAFDAKKEALELCKAMANTNEVSDRIIYDGFCSEKVIKDFVFHGRGLIICDCEGYEINLFTKESVKNLQHCDLIIELHDHLDSRISPTILPLFEATHDIHLISSEIKDPSQFEELKGFNKYDQQLILSESRDGLLGTKPMYWAYIISRTQA